MNNLKYSNGSATYVESLEKKIAELEKQIVAIDMNNEPVAWINKVTFQYLTELGYSAKVYPKRSDGDIPLYTNPVKELDEDFDAICLENKRLQVEIDSLKDKLMLAKQSLEIVEGWIKE